MNIILKNTLSIISNALGFRVSRIGNTGGGYISAKDVVAAAEEAGMSVCDYVERLWNISGQTQHVIDQMKKSGAIGQGGKVLEIGAGTGRYMEKILENSSPIVYQSYETALDWANYLDQKYPIETKQADGYSLKETANNSIDLVCAHGVFVYLPFLVSVRYFKEIFRVSAVGAYVVFDIVSENVLDHQDIQKWLNSSHNYPCFLSKKYIVDLFAENGYCLTQCFFSPYGPARSEYLIFNRKVIN